MIASFKKNINILLVLVTLISTSVFAETDRSCRKKVICADTVKAKTICADELIVKTGCCASYTITAKDFMDADGNLSQTFVITEPGKYSLGENIDFAPVDEFVPSIRILSNDVKLDLCSNTLQQTNLVANVTGIQIGEDGSETAVFKNITIINGTVLKFTGQGIGALNIAVAVTGEAFESLSFLDLNILECGSSPSDWFASGINLDSFASSDTFDPANPVAYKNITVENCRINRCIGNAGMQIFTFDNLVINNTQANDVTSTISTFFGDDFGPSAYVLVGKNLQMFNCQGNNVQNLDPNTFFASTGSFITGCINVHMKDCQFNNAFGEVDGLVSCVFFSNMQNGIIENCQFNNARGGQFAGRMCGVHMSDGPFQTTEGNGVKFIDCQFNGASVSSTNPGGSNFRIEGFFGLTIRNIIFENCQACNIITENSFDAFGFNVLTSPQDPAPEFANSQNITFNNCTATDIQGGKRAIGYQLAVVNGNRTGTQASLDNMVLENCITERIHSSSSTERVAGIFEGLISASVPQGPFPAQFNLFVKNCRVSDVRAGAENPLSAGILVESVKRPNITASSISDCDRGVLFTGTDLITPDTLFQLAETFTGATAFPPVFIDLTSIPAAVPLQSFSNVTQSNTIDIAPSSATIELARNYIFSPTDLNTLGWQAGDEIVYNNNGGTDIGGLVSGNTYYAIVYIPGFAENGVVMDNTVDNCTVSGYEDAKPITSSAWVNNFAFNCGQPASEEANYDINWSGTSPVYAGDLSDYPTGSAKAFNISLIP